MATELRGYAASISKYTGVTDPEALAEIEDFMRLEYRTLDHLDSRQFARCARESHAAYQYEQTPEGKAYIAQLEREMMGEAA